MYEWIVSHPRQFGVGEFYFFFVLILWIAFYVKLAFRLKRYQLSLQGERAWSLHLEEDARKQALGELYTEFSGQPMPAHATERYRFLERYYDEIGRPMSFTGPSDYADGP